MRSARCLLAALLCALLLPAVALAADEAWSKTFTGPQMTSALESAQHPFLVVGAGEAGSGAAPAASALAAALRSGTGAKLVMDGAALGDVSALDDAAIVKKCEKLPVERIAVVRVFPAGEGQEPNAVVTVYDKSANVVTALTATKGSAYAESGAGGLGLAASQGVTGNVATVAGAVVSGGAKADKKAKEQYEERMIWFRDMVAVNQYGRTVSAWSDPVEGRYMKPLDTPTFFEKVGKKELAEEYRAKESARWTTCVAGSVITTVLASGLFVWGLTADYEDGSARPITGIIGGSLVVPLVGGLITGLAMPTLPKMDGAEARRLADEHNKKLAAEVGYRIED